MGYRSGYSLIKSGNRGFCLHQEVNKQALPLCWWSQEYRKDMTFHNRLWSPKTTGRIVNEGHALLDESKAYRAGEW